jgi:WD40 repeat protein
MSSSASKSPVVMLRRAIRCRINDVVHLHGGHHIITYSIDGSLRLWDLESGAQIGEDLQGEVNAEVRVMAMYPNGKTIANGSGGMNTNVR